MGKKIKVDLGNYQQDFMRGNNRDYHNNKSGK